MHNLFWAGPDGFKNYKNKCLRYPNHQHLLHWWLPTVYNCVLLEHSLRPANKSQKRGKKNFCCFKNELAQYVYTENGPLMHDSPKQGWPKRTIVGGKKSICRTTSSRLGHHFGKEREIAWSEKMHGFLSWSNDLAVDKAWKQPHRITGNKTTIDTWWTHECGNNPNLPKREALNN